MKRLFVLTIMLAACTAVSAQQNQVLSAASSDCSVANSCLVYGVDPTVGGATFTVSVNAGGNTLQFEGTGNGTLWVALNATPSNSSTAASSTTSTGTWQVNVAAYITIRIRMSTQASGNSTVSIITSTASARGGSGGGAGGTIIAVTGTSPVVSSGGTSPAISCPTCNTPTNSTAALTDAVNPKIASTYNYGGTPAYGDTQQVVDAVCTNGGHICTSATANWCDGLVTACTTGDSPDPGKNVFVIFTTGGGNTSSPAVTTIASVQSATQMTMTGIIAGGACTGTNCTLTWGHDDTTALKAASDFAKVGGAFQGPYLTKAKTLYVPRGGYMFSNTIVNWRGVTGNDLGPNLLGDGVAATIFFNTPDINVSDNMISIRGYGGYYRQFSIEGSNAQIGDNNEVIFFNCSDCSAQDIRVNNIHNSSSTGSDIYVQSTHMSLRDVGAVTSALEVGDSNILCQVNASTGVTWEQPFCSNGWKNFVIANIPGGGTGSNVTIVGGSIDECGDTVAGEACTMVTASKDVSFLGTGILEAQNGIPVYGLFVDGTSEVHLVNDNVGCFGSGVGCNGTNGSALNIASGGKVWATGSQFRSYGSGHGVAGPSGAFFFDVGGNCVGVLTSPGACTGSTGGGFSGGINPRTSLTHSANTCYDTLATFGATTLCNQYLDQGTQVVRVLASSNVTTTCASAPVVTLSNGTSSQTLTLTSGAATWDSGATATTYGGGTTLTATVSAGTCATPPTNLAVTFTYQSFASN